MSNILIAAFDGFLGTRIAARFLTSGNHVILLTDEIGFASPEELLSSIEKAVQNISTDLEDVPRLVGYWRRSSSCRFRRRHVELPGATHYSIYDRTELVAAMLRRFFQDPSSVANAQPLLAGTSL